SLSGRDWSCFRNTVSITALSAVGAAFSAGGDAGCCGAVCAAAPEPNAKTLAETLAKTLAETPASTAILIHDPFACDIAVSFLNSSRDDCGPRSLRGCRGL